MNLSLFGKFETIFKYIFSSFLSIEMFILSLLLFLILIINLKRNNHLVQMIAIGIYIGFVIGILISYSNYVKTCVDSFVKAIMNYIYFPSTYIKRSSFSGICCTASSALSNKFPKTAHKSALCKFV